MRVETRCDLLSRSSRRLDCSNLNVYSLYGGVTVGYFIIVNPRHKLQS